MFDAAKYDTEDRRRLAEAQGWRHDPECAFGRWISPDGRVGCEMPDPLRDDGDAWRLACWLASQPMRTVEIGRFLGEPTGRPEAFLLNMGEDICTAHPGDTFNAALVSAALAWLDAKEASRG